MHYLCCSASAQLADMASVMAIGKTENSPIPPSGWPNGRPMRWTVGVLKNTQR